MKQVQEVAPVAAKEAKKITAKTVDGTKGHPMMKAAQAGVPMTLTREADKKPSP